MFYSLKYESLDESKETIYDDIYHYDNKRIKSKLIGLSQSNTELNSIVLFILL